ncbi:hypothetical protein HMPREF0864_04711 [Enterobacteriaceae bacterium 9_2_54FAA]|nr:hypothetical protein HMPREF0864_04711 [Enterobacteriaceae bacterium 9_2_54FAA]
MDAAQHAMSGCGYQAVYRKIGKGFDEGLMNVAMLPAVVRSLSQYGGVKMKLLEAHRKIECANMFG